MAGNGVIPSRAGEFVMFASDDATIRIRCRFEHETFWLSQPERHFITSRLRQLLRISKQSKK